MIQKIQELIEDNTSLDITRSQIIMGLTVIGLLLLLIIFFMFGSSGAKEESDNYVPPKPNPTADSIHLQQ
jgi:hypothetical protein